MKYFIRPLYWHIRKLLLNNKLVRNFYLKRNFVKKDNTKDCPVCNSSKSRIIKFMTESVRVEKNLCESCGHLYSDWLNNSLENAKKLFNYDFDNHNNIGQKELILKSIDYSKLDIGKFLDFGVGGNMSVYSSINGKHSIFGCDIVERNEKNYFVTYQDPNMHHFFDAISSNAVVEHLYNTKEAWLYFNRLLKPLSEGGGIMLHAFPSQIDFDFSHWTIQIKSHVCLFSLNSLQSICEYSGFEIVKIEYDSRVQHPIHYFKKVKDL